MNEEEKREMRQQRIDERRLRQKRRKKQQIVLTIILILIIVAMVIMGVKLMNKREMASVSKLEVKPTEQVTPTPEVTPEVTPTTTPTPEPTPTEEPIQKISDENLNSSYGYLIRLSDQAVMMDKESTARMYPSSLTKIMTALVSVEHLQDLDERVVLSGDMIRKLYDKGASMAHFVGGENVTVRDLLYGAMLPSGADACVGLAQKIAGSEEAFVEMMNQKAAEMGLKGTHFVNSTGLHDEEHYSTCQDIAIILKHALNNENFRSVFTSENYTTTSTPPHPNGITFENKMFQRMEDPNLSNGGVVVGGKTGYTSYSGLCLASLAKVGEEEYILVTAHAEGTPNTEQYNITDALYVYNQINVS